MYKLVLEQSIGMDGSHQNGSMSIRIAWLAAILVPRLILYVFSHINISIFLSELVRNFACSGFLTSTLVSQNQIIYI